MSEGVLYLVSGFWLGALHAATPGHGKTIAAAYIVGARGRPVDAVVLGVFVTLSHTIGIVLVAVLASLGAAWSVPARVEAYLAVLAGLLVIAIGVWMTGNQWRELFPRHDHHRHGEFASAQGHEHAENIAPRAAEHEHGGAAHRHEPPVDHRHEHDQKHDHPHPHPHGDRDAQASGYHRHGWGPAHTHGLDVFLDSRPSWAILLGLGLAGGLLPDPGALAILLAAIAGGKLVMGLLTVLVFSIGFASVLVVVGVVAARVGQLVLTWLSGRWMLWLQLGTALLIFGVGIVLTLSAWRTLAALV